MLSNSMSIMSLLTILLELSPLCAILYIYLLWNKLRYSKPPNVFLKKSLFNSLAIQYCDDMLRKPYVPTIWAFSPRIHSSYFSFKRMVSPSGTTEYLEVKGGRIVGISWPALDSNSRIQQNSPVVMFIPSPFSEDNSIWPFIETSSRHGFRPSIFQHRNSETLPRLRHASESSSFDHRLRIGYVEDWKDLAEAVQYVANKFPVSPLYLVSLSYGGTVLLKFLAYDARSRCIKGVVTVSPAWSTLSYPFSSLKPVKGNLKPNASSFHHSLSLDSFKKLLSRRRSQPVYSERFQHLSTTLPIEVFAMLKKLTVPMLMIYSTDDPVLSSDDKCRIRGAWKNSELLLVVETAIGGHSGFLQGLIPESWAAKLVFLYFDAVETFKDATVG